MSLILPFLIAGASKDIRTQLIQRLLPLLLPGSQTDRLAFTTITAEQDIKQQTRAENELVIEAVTAGNFSDPSALDRFPKFKAAFNRLSAADQKILFPGQQPQGPGDNPARDRRDPGNTPGRNPNSPGDTDARNT